jgi:hypothetical protein
LSTICFSFSTGGVVEHEVPDHERLLGARAAATTSSASLARSASGFSTSTWRPAASAATACSACAGAGVASTTASTSALVSARRGSRPSLACGAIDFTRGERLLRGSQTMTRSAPLARANARTWLMPQAPAPTTAIFTLTMPPPRRVEARDLLEHVRLLRLAQLGVDGQRQRLARRRLRARERALALLEVGEARLQVEGHRVVDLGADAGLGEVLAQRVAARRADDELVVDVTGRVVGQADLGGEARVGRGKPAVAIGVGAARRRSTRPGAAASRAAPPPAAYRGEVAADRLVVVLRPAAVRAQEPHAVGEGRVVGIDRARVAEAPRFFDGKKDRQPQIPVSGALPIDCAASSMTGTETSGRGAARPYRCTEMTAFVREVHAACAARGSRLKLAGSMSAKTGRAPSRAIARPSRRRKTASSPPRRLRPRRAP